MNIKDKLKGALYGFAVGDAMGATTEFMDEQEIKEQYGKIEDILGGGWLNLKAGGITDDTEMSLCIMRVLVKNDYKNFKRDVAESFTHWINTDPKDVGNQCRRAINYYRDMNEYIYCDNTALGNGSLMRALPCSLLNNEHSEQLNVIQGEITHNNEICKDIIIRYTRVIKDALNNKKINEHTDRLLEPSGYVVNTFNNALYWSDKESFEECIIGAVNNGGDSDTIAAIAGGISGAKFGYSNIPYNWISKINQDTKNELNQFLSYIIKLY